MENERSDLDREWSATGKHLCKYSSSERLPFSSGMIVHYQCRICGAHWEKDVS